jgi:hypothetical protein
VKKPTALILNNIIYPLPYPGMYPEGAFPHLLSP